MNGSSRAGATAVPAQSNAFIRRADGSSPRSFVPGKWQEDACLLVFWNLSSCWCQTCRHRLGPGAMTTPDGGSLSQLGFAHLREQSYAIDSSAAAKIRAVKPRPNAGLPDLPQLLQINCRAGRTAAACRLSSPPWRRPPVWSADAAAVARCIPVAKCQESRIDIREASWIRLGD